MTRSFDALREVLRLGLRNMRGYPLRTFLTTLGVVFGVASVIIMRAVGAGAEAEILREMGRLGIDNVIVNSVKPPEPRHGDEARFVMHYGLRFKDAKAIERTIPGLTRVLPVHAKAARAWAGSRKAEATLYGVTAAHMPLLGLDVARGRAIDAVDNDRLERVCVVRPSLMRALSPFEDPIGATLRLGDDVYRVVGLLRDERLLGYVGKALAYDQKTSEIYVPFDTLVKREGTLSVHFQSGSRESTDVELSQLVIGVARVEDAVEAARMISTLLESTHDQKDYEVIVPLEYLRQRKRTQDVFNYTFLAIAAISLLVGGIGIANIMLATVTERTKEIG
ncbi:MAG TPA: ABC transporter permease, partial [Planctomycetota bacterium]|nr:ABC transporter permease [Planctomycetota bacterium]